ncbi:MAG: LytTR family DNA-binding domain-containing protein [Burkholderiales bacterium]|nr:LytTR family DNA-binding domain-containing protein [Burkholderiales bacterium]
MPSVLIADDEPLLREQLKSRLNKLWPEGTIVAEAVNGAEALALFEEHQPDVVFLDIHMPVMTGLEAARLIGGGRSKRAHLVFVTAFDEHAVEAFERGAIDYVLKPFNEPRLLETISRLRERLDTAAEPSADATSEEQNLASVLRQLGDRMGLPSVQYLRWIKASVGQTVRLIPVEEVVYFQSDEKYTRVVLDDAEVLIRKPIKELLEELDPRLFWQIHRATVVNTRAIAGVVRGLRDQGDLKLKGRAETLTVSRNFTHLFKQM